MNARQIKQARQLLGLNQTAFATLLGWTSKRNVVSIERGDKETMMQTALAIECLLRRNNKFGEFEMINKMQPVLKWIISEIERINSEREDGRTISEDETNQELVDIFHRTANKFTDIDFELVDDEDALTNVFGSAGFQAIREAEQGRY
jgi:DNA-binding XRE family transcriptional regulator